MTSPSPAPGPRANGQPGRRAKKGHEQHRAGEPFLLWWMPVVALLAPLLSAAWFGANSDGSALGDAAFALLWPGVPLYFATVVVLWGGWKIELE